MPSREVAWRVFAGEFNASTLNLEGTDDRAPSYVVTPLGAKINRLFAIGTLTSVENIGSEDDPMWRAQLSDSTGTFYLSAGQYQPEAAHALSKLQPPAFVAVIGKSRTYSPEEGVVYVSIRPETIREVTAAERDYWVLETCLGMKDRIDASNEAMQMDPATPEKLSALGISPSLSCGIPQAISHYGDMELEWYRNMLIDSLKYLIPEHRDSVSMEERVPDPPPRAKKEEPSEEGKDDLDISSEPPSSATEMENSDDAEQKLMDIISSLDTDINGAVWDEILKKAQKDGIDRMTVEETTNSLLDKGLIYEPVLGRIKRI